MGNMTEKEKIAIGIIALIFSPFIILGRVIKSIGESLGVIEPEKYDYNPKLDPNYVPPELEPKVDNNTSSGQVTEPPVSKPQIGQGFDNPNRLDPNS